jgi:hypothetical protein
VFRYKSDRDLVGVMEKGDVGQELSPFLITTVLSHCSLGTLIPGHFIQTTLLMIQEKRAANTKGCP